MVVLKYGKIQVRCINLSTPHCRIVIMTYYEAQIPTETWLAASQTFSFGKKQTESQCSVI